MDGNEEEKTGISRIEAAAESSAECVGAAAAAAAAAAEEGRAGGDDGHDAASMASSGCAAVVVAAAAAAEAAEADDQPDTRQGASNRTSEEGDGTSATGTETETTTTESGGTEDNRASATACAAKEGARISGGTAAAAAASSATAATANETGSNNTRNSSEINRLQKEKLQMLQYEAVTKAGNKQEQDEESEEEKMEEQPQQQQQQQQQQGRGVGDKFNADDNFAENTASSCSETRRPPSPSTAPAASPWRLSAEDGPVIMRTVPSEPGAYHVRPISTATLSSSDRRRSSASQRRSNSRSTRASAEPPAPSAASAADSEGDLEMAEMGSTTQSGREGTLDDEDGISAITESYMDSTAALTTIATPLQAHTYVEAIEVIPEETEDSSYDMEKVGGSRRTTIVLAFLVAALALAIGLGVGLGRGGGDGTAIAPSTLVSDVPMLNTSKLVEVNLTFLSSSASPVPPAAGGSEDPDSIILGLQASAMVKGSPSAAVGGLVQVFDREKVEGGSNNDFVYNETLRTSPFTSQLPRGVAPEEVVVGPAFDSSGRITNVAVSFLGKEGGPGFVRVFDRENGLGVLPNGREWWQVGQDVGLGLVNDFIDPQSDGFAAGYGASVGYAANANGHLIVGSDAGFARLYFLQANAEANRWVRIDANRLVSSSDATDDNPVIVASRNFRFSVSYPREGPGKVSLFELIDPRTGETFTLNASPLEPPRLPNFLQFGQTLQGLAPGDGFGWSMSGDVAGRAWAIGCESGGYVQTFRLNEETGKLEQFGNTLVGDPEDEGGFGHSLKLGLFAANAGSCPTCGFQLDGLRMIVGSPFYNSGRGRAVVFEYSELDSEWKRLPFLEGSSESERFGYSVSLSIEQSTVAVTYDAGSRSEDEPRGTGTQMWRIAKA